LAGPPQRLSCILAELVSFCHGALHPLSAPLVAKRMHGRRGESEQNSSRGPAMHPAAVLNPADTFADLTVGCALTGRPALAIGWQVPYTCGPRPRPVLRVTSTRIRAPSLASLLASLQHLHAYDHGERPRSRGVPCHVSPVAQYCAVSWRMLTRQTARAGMHNGHSHVLLVEDKEAFQDLDPLVILDAVSDGAEALAFLRREGAHVSAVRPALVVLDPKWMAGKYSISSRRMRA
jgi:hypothetical protein